MTIQNERARGVDIIRAARALNEKTSRTTFFHFCDPTLAFKDPIHEKLLALWRIKAGSRPMPAKSEISPRDLKNFLGDIVICQRIAQKPSVFVWRLVGTRVETVVGNVTGKTFEESAPVERARLWIECCDLVLDGGQPLRFVGRVHIKDREYLFAENFFMPLANDEGEPTFVMGMCRYSPRQIDEEESWKKEIAAISF